MAPGSSKSRRDGSEDDESSANSSKPRRMDAFHSCSRKDNLTEATQASLISCLQGHKFKRGPTGHIEKRILHSGCDTQAMSPEAIG